jgi:hypothetical protein
MAASNGGIEIRQKELQNSQRKFQYSSAILKISHNFNEEI